MPLQVTRLGDGFSDWRYQVDFRQLAQGYRLYPKTIVKISDPGNYGSTEAQSSYTCPKSSFISPSRRQHGFLHCMSAFRLPRRRTDGSQCAIVKAKEGKIDEIHSRTSPFHSDYLS